ncbi:uncharacterized protein L201_006334 [Kwoniella dendrophila CBS 6074]|uniref:Uncharacterized protein n=1 Tax=Kwoniella dendrophila CBS 6074 TaxID=1295534 RepID=A0AAX4K174_9TREE
MPGILSDAGGNSDFTECPYYERINSNVQRAKTQYSGLFSSFPNSSFAIITLEDSNRESRKIGMANVQAYRTADQAKQALFQSLDQSKDDAMSRHDHTSCVDDASRSSVDFRTHRRERPQEGYESGYGV